MRKCTLLSIPIIVICTGQSALAQVNNLDESGLVVVASAGSVSNAGESTIILGSGFTSSTQVQICLDPCTSPNAWISPNPVTSYINANEITASIPATTAGNYDMVVSHGADARSSNPALLVVQAVLTPPACASTYAAGSLIGWFRGDSMGATTWVDKSSYAQTLTNTGTPYVNSADPNFNNEPTVYFDGGANYSAVASGFSIEGSRTFWAFIVSRDTNTANTVLHVYSASGASIQSNILRSAGVANTPVNATNWTNKSVGWQWWEQGDGGYETFGTQIGIGGSPSIYDAGSSFLLPSTANMSIPATTAFGPLVYADVVVVNTIPSAPYFACLYDYANTRYDLDALPTIVGVTPTQVTGGPVRVSGSGFLQSATVSFGGGIGSAGATFITSSSLAGSLAGPAYIPANYDTTVTNPDGNSITGANTLTVETTTDPWNILGANTVAWFRADHITSPIPTPITGSAVSGLIDLSRLLNDVTQSTSANQPTWNSGDACAGGQPTVQFNGSEWLANTAFNIVGSTTGNSLYMWFVFCESNSPGTGNNYTFASYGTGVAEMRLANTGDPTYLPGVTLLTSVVDGGSANALMGFALNTNTTEWNLGISLNNGAYTYADSGATVITSGGSYVVGARTVAGVNGSVGLHLAELVVSNAQITPTQLSALQSYAFGCATGQRCY